MRMLASERQMNKVSDGMLQVGLSCKQRDSPQQKARIG
jgi:hypothetical protein